MLGLISCYHYSCSEMPIYYLQYERLSLVRANYCSSEITTPTSEVHVSTKRARSDARRQTCYDLYWSRRQFVLWSGQISQTVLVMIWIGLAYVLLSGHVSHTVRVMIWIDLADSTHYDLDRSRRSTCYDLDMSDRQYVLWSGQVSQTARVIILAGLVIWSGHVSQTVYVLWSGQVSLIAKQLRNLV